MLPTRVRAASTLAGTTNKSAAVLRDRLLNFGKKIELRRAIIRPFGFNNPFIDCGCSSACGSAHPGRERSGQHQVILFRGHFWSVPCSPSA